MQARSEQLTALQQVKDDMFGAQGETSVGLTGADLEEEALLVLVRRHNQNNATHDAGSGKRGKQDKGVHETSSKSISTSTANLLAEFEQFELESSSDDSEADNSDKPDEENNNNSKFNISDANSGLHGSPGEAEDVGGNTKTPAENSGNPEKMKKRKIQVNIVLKLMKLWASNVTNTVVAVMDAHTRNTTQGISSDGEVSIVLSKPANVAGPGSSESSAVEPLFVRWHNPDEFEGRVVRIDQHHRVVWSPSTLFGKPIPTRVFDSSSFDILVTAVGAKCVKISGSGRDILPPTMVRFIQFVNMVGISWNEDRGHLLFSFDVVSSRFVYFLYYQITEECGPYRAHCLGVCVCELCVNYSLQFVVLSVKFLDNQVSACDSLEEIYHMNM